MIALINRYNLNNEFENSCLVGISINHDSRSCEIKSVTDVVKNKKLCSNNAFSCRYSAGGSTLHYVTIKVG